MFKEKVDMKVFVYRADGSLYDTFIVTTSYPAFSIGWERAVKEDGNYIGDAHVIVEYEYKGLDYKVERKYREDY